jgi:hypothetical protein
MERAKLAAGQIFSSYPDYGKAPKEYLASVIEYLALLPDYVVAKLADRQTGIATKSQYLPTIAEIKIAADTIMEDRAKEVRYANLQSRRIALPSYRVPFRPFPKLWGAFADEPAVIKLLDHPGSFDFLNVASRTLATQGKEAARTFILSTDGNKSVDTRATSEAAA